MNEPQLLAILIIIGFFAVVLALGGFLIHRTMTRPNSHIGARLPMDESFEPSAETGLPPDLGSEDGDGERS
ncbi:hypothetical protein GCM10022261_21380 [Brevibacterium daeguense]|uniref:Uncharacterized protein n=1 Tax=Brevibacterium daeguense TaxID=909936 RepID=A0ABP8EKV6_9MICO|nr:hypothetical protein [Brevibacterium daeguense]